MVAAGGSATINGILFQLLGTLGHAAEVWLAPQVWQNEDLRSALLTVEPAGGGGDLRLAAGSHRIVEQWKVRDGSRTWSLRDVIEEVIPDLYLAVDKEAKAYRFRTNGRMGSWGAAYTFFRNLGEPPNDPSPALLDDSTQRRFARGVRLSERQLFQWVVEAIRSRREVAQEPISQTHIKLWHMLSRFEMPSPVALPDLASRIEKALEAHVERIEDVEAKRHEICARIATLAARGEVRLTPEDVLKEAGLSIASFLRWNDARKRLRDRLQQRIEQAGYRSTLDVRPPSQSLLDYAVIVFASGSGQGKTWQLASLALAAADEPGLVAWVPSARRGEPADAVAADEIWKRGLGHDQRLDLEDVVERRARTNPNAPVPWATICIDDVRTPEEADYLTTLEWKRWGIRLALTCSPELARRLKHVWGSDAAVVEVTNFTHPQLRDYLQRRGRPWADTPPDVREVIRRPVLARIYGDLAETAQWTPRHEYELMDAYWSRIRQRGQPVDEAVLRDLAGQLLDAEPVYPWPPAALQAAGATPEILSRLEVAGWIQQNEDGDVELWHDRLLGWAAAKAIVHRLRQQRMTQQQLEAFLTSLENADNPTLRRLVYLPMDLLWLILDPRAPAALQQTAFQVLAVLDQASGHGFEAEQFYQKVLPTLGSRIAPVFVERLKQVDPEGPNRLPRLVASALRAIAEGEPDPVATQVSACLQSPSRSLQEVALRLLAEMPTADVVERVWELHRPLARNPSDDFQRHQLTSRALAATVAVAPARAVELLQRPESDEIDLVTFMYALAGAGGEEAGAVWHAHKKEWIPQVPAAHARCIVNCILRFRDDDEIGRLKELTASPEEVVGPMALATLALFDPARAVDRLHAPPPQRLWAVRQSLSQTLLAFVPEKMLTKVRRLASQRPEGAVVYLQMLVSGGDRLEPEATDALIEWADRTLVEYLSDLKNQDKHQLHPPLSRPLMNSHERPFFFPASAVTHVIGA